MALRQLAFGLVGSALLWSPLAAAQELVDSQRAFTREGLEFTDLGLDLTLQPGLRWFMAPVAPGIAFSQGGGVDLGLHLRLAGGFTLGVEGGFAGGSLAAMGLEGGPAVGGGQEAGFNVYKLALRSSTPVDPFWFELSGGLGYLNAGGVGGGTIQNGTFGAKVGLQFSPVAALPNLSLGAFAGVELWQTFDFCDASGSCESPVDEEPYVALQAGVGARFILPLTYRPKPPPPPTEQFLLVVSRLEVATSDSMLADVTPTPAYEQALPQLKRVALSAPDYCANRSAADTTGQAAQTNKLMQTACGVEMGEVERALTKAGYVVSSWTTLASMVEDQKLTPRDAAAKLGAQVLFQVNSLEHVQSVPDLQGRWQRSYHASNSYADPGDVVQPETDELPSLQRILGKPGATQGAVPGAMLDVNAILVETGQTIWFYRWQHLDTTALGRETRVLAQRWSNEKDWKPAIPRVRATDDAPTHEADDGTFQQLGGPSSVKDARYFRLMREVVGDFVSRFTQRSPGS